MQKSRCISEYSLQEHSVQVNTVFKDYNVQVNIVCKMTVCNEQREYEDSLQEHGL